MPDMADEGSDNKAQPPLVDRILQCGKQAFDPEIPWDTRKANVSVFSALLERFVKFLIFKLFVDPFKYKYIGTNAGLESACAT